MSAGDELLNLVDDDPSAAAAVKSWNVLVVDDEPEVHSVTRFALEDFKFKGRGIKLLNAYSGREAVAMMAGRSDVALIIMDVVMETDSAGLDAIRQIREEQKNWLTRIILRTGQPGQAPEQKVILNYDINDYKSKTELTATKLFSAVVTALRSFDDLMRLEESQQGLRRMLLSFSNEVIERAVDSFLSGALIQVESLIRLGDHSMGEPAGALAVSLVKGVPVVIAATGGYEPLMGRPISTIGQDEIRRDLEQAIAHGQDLFRGSYAIHAIPSTEHHPAGVFFFSGESSDQDNFLSPPERKLLSDYLQGVQATTQFAVRIRALATH